MSLEGEGGSSRDGSPPFFAHEAGLRQLTDGGRVLLACYDQKDDPGPVDSEKAPTSAAPSGVAPRSA